MKDKWYEDLMNLPPEEFERRRQEIIDEYINGLPEEKQPRERARQWKIDLIRKKYKHPLVVAQQLHNMMWASLIDYFDALRGDLPINKKANIIKFK